MWFAEREMLAEKQAFRIEWTRNPVVLGLCAYVVGEKIEP